jgi:hypothetical protein
MTSDEEQPLPGSLGAHLLETYYRTLDEALAAMPPAPERRLEEMGYVLPRPSARLLLPVRERPRAD